MLVYFITGGGHLDITINYPEPRPLNSRLSLAKPVQALVLVSRVIKKKNVEYLARQEAAIQI